MTVMNNIPSNREVIIKRFFWRGNSLWVRFSLEGYPPRFPLGIKRISSSKTEIARCLKLGEEKLAALRAETSLKGTVFDRELVESQKEYNPSFCALCLLYYHNKLKYKKSGKNEWYHLQHSFKRFGKLPAKSIRREDIEVWRQEQKLSGVAVNTINNRFAYLQAVYAWSNQDPEPEHRIHPCSCGTAPRVRTRGKYVQLICVTCGRSTAKAQFPLLSDLIREWNGPDKYELAFRAMVASL